MIGVHIKSSDKNIAVIQLSEGKEKKGGEGGDRGVHPHIHAPLFQMALQYVPSALFTQMHPLQNQMPRKGVLAVSQQVAGC